MKKNKIIHVPINAYLNDKTEINIREYTTNTVSPWIEHDFFSIIYILEGTGKYLTSKKKKNIKKGDIYFLNCGEPHRWVPECNIKNISLRFNKNIIRSVAKLVKNSPILRHTGITRYASGKTLGFYYLSLKGIDAITIRHIFLQILSEYKKNEQSCIEIIKLKLAEILLFLNRYSDANPEKGRQIINDVVEEKIFRAADYISKNYREKLTLKTISARHEINSDSLSRNFKKHTGYRLFEYLNEIRIQEACKMLTANTKIIDIAYNTGFQTLSFFNKVFKKTMHCSPRSFRNALSKKV